MRTEVRVGSNRQSRAPMAPNAGRGTETVRMTGGRGKTLVGWSGLATAMRELGGGKADLRNCRARQIQQQTSNIPRLPHKISNGGAAGETQARAPATSLAFDLTTDP